MSISHKGKKLTPEHKAKMATAHKGKDRSPETKLKISIVMSGKKHTSEHIAKIAATLRGRKRSPEIGLKIFIAKKGLYIGAENWNSRPILCIELDKKFDSASLAAKFIRETKNPKANVSSIAACARGSAEYPHSYGFTWKYI